ncbi:hypothetical protein ACIQRS_06845 [Streptomyces termitum]|uniref:Serine/arginine repetitive matrix protein 2 n=1 Tax=Streptomyces termitum TaxID=67368 RepID=A0A918W551_9ACTN|nr:hypothetical protein [Streptomyces termitum]GHA66750.1 hypothetical protein GCM10010305_05900 [Streptomyces termitum]
MGTRAGGGARWNDETQSWERTPADGGTAPPVPGTPPLLPPPAYAPEVPAGGYDPVYGAGPGGAVPGRSRVPGPVVAGVVAALVAGAAVGGWMTWRGDRDAPPPAAGGPAASVSPTGGPDGTEPSGGESGASPTPSGDATSATPSDGAPPPGYWVGEDLKGFTIAVPKDWNRTENEQGVFFNAPDGRSLIQVFVIEGAGTTPYEALRGASAQGGADKPGYEELSLGPVTGEPGAPSDAAELVYAYDREGGRRKVVDRAFTAPDGNRYAILAAGPEGDWPLQRERLRVALDFFRPGAY